MLEENKRTEELEAAREQLSALLEQMHRKGVELFVDGREAQPEEVVRKAVCEDSPYMADYVLGENGCLEQVRFDRVTAP